MTLPSPRRLFEQFGPPLLVLCVLLTAWQAAVRLFDVPPWLLPAPTDIGVRLIGVSRLWHHTSQTLLEAACGFAVSAVVGVGLSAAIVHSRMLERGLFPYIVIANAIPIIAIIPLLTIWFGFGIGPRIMICAIISFFPIVTNSTRGLRSADRRIVEFMHSINATAWQRFYKLQLPSALPFIFAGFKIAGSLALIGAVVSEFYSSDRGLGYLVITSATELRTDLLFAAITVLAGLGILSFSLFGYLEQMATRGETADNL